MKFHDKNMNPVKKPRNTPVEWRISAYAFVMDKEKVLVVQPIWNTIWELPGGGIESNESIEKGVQRECLEESGYRIKFFKQQPLYVGEDYIYLVRRKKYCHSLIVIYPAVVTSSIQEKDKINPKGSIETEKVEWLSLEKLSKENIHPIFVPVLNEVKRKRKSYFG